MSSRKHFRYAPHALMVLLGLAMATAAQAGQVTFTTEDGVILRGEDFGGGTRGAVLIHGRDRTSEDWTYFAGKLAEKDFHVLIFDLRGHGTSGSAEPDGAGDGPAMVADVTAALGWLKQRGATEITLVGSELGANLAVNAAAPDTSVVNLVLVSPGMNLDGVPVKQPLIDYGDRPLMVVASNEDAYAAKTGRFLSAIATGPKQLTVVESGSGTRLINRDIDLETQVLQWIAGGWREVEAAVAPAERELLEAGSTDDIETTGIKFGDR
jgi:pimeloyl-ACP methyl ester carboxylesterase